MSSSSAPIQGWRMLAQHALLLTIPLFSFPLSLLALFYNYAALVLCPQNSLRHHVRRSSRFRCQRVVITGISTPVGLRAARALYYTGHEVIGVAERGPAILNYARWSKAVSKLYVVRPPLDMQNTAAYTEQLLRIVINEKARLWINLSEDISLETQADLKRTIEQKTPCVCLAADQDQVKNFGSRYNFQRFVQQLGLPVHEIHSVNSRHDIHNVLNDSKGKRFLLSSSEEAPGRSTRTILPKRTVSQTYHDVAQLRMSKGSSWILEQYNEDLPRYTACAVVVHGQVKAYAASSVFMSRNYKAVPTDSGLSQAMQRYLQDFSQAIGDHFSGHLTVEFSLNEKATHAGVVQQILPVHGHLAAHNTLLLFNGKRGSVDLTQAYMSALASSANGLGSYTGLPYNESSEGVVVPAEPVTGVYYLYHDLNVMFVEPMIQLIRFMPSVRSALQIWLEFLSHLLGWQEVLYDFGDPLPLFWYTYVSTPAYLLARIIQNIRSQLSRRKM